MSRHHRAIPPRLWRRARRAALERDGWRCRACGRAGRLEADHVVPLDRGGAPLDPANLQALCRACHVAKTAAENLGSPMPAGWRALVGELVDGFQGKNTVVQVDRTPMKSRKHGRPR